VNDQEIADQLACRHFYAFADDIDILTVPEMREKIQGIWGEAEDLASADVQAAAHSMLVSVTQGNIEGLTEAVLDMDTACDDVEPL
jgi:hypothetical protein